MLAGAGWSEKLGKASGKRRNLRIYAAWPFQFVAERSVRLNTFLTSRAARSGIGLFSFPLLDSSGFLVKGIDLVEEDAEDHPRDLRGK